MRFDVVIGNPPFQGVHKKASKLWPKFYELGMGLLKEDGILTYVAPATWLNRAPRGAWRYLSQWDIVTLTSDASQWFPGVGSTFAVTQIYDRPYGGVTRVNDTFDLDLHSDVFPADNTQLTEENTTFIRQMKSSQLTLDIRSGSQIPIDDPRLSLTQTEEHQYETYYSSAKNRRSIWCSEPHGEYGKLKLIVGLYGNPLKTPEISTKSAGAKTKYILGNQKDLEYTLSLIQRPDNMKWVSMMQTDAFSHPLTYLSDS